MNTILYCLPIGWCRLEMVYAANIPLIISQSRLQYFQLHFRQLITNGVRPHILFGSRELQNNISPLVLPSFQNSFIEELHPKNGRFLVESDRYRVTQLMVELDPYMRSCKIGYEGIV